MARLIDATRIEQFVLNNCSDNEEINTIYGELINAPTIDIVTCGECVYCEESEYIKGDMACKYHIGHTYYTEADRFCYYGDRRSE